jgi:hypothetical protein
MSKSIDVSTHQLAEQVQKALGGKVKLEDVLTVWHSIGEEREEERRREAEKTRNEGSESVLSLLNESEARMRQHREIALSTRTTTALSVRGF